MQKCILFLLSYHIMWSLSAAKSLTKYSKIQSSDWSDAFSSDWDENSWAVGTSDTGATVISNDDVFQVCMDVAGFCAKELLVKTSDGCLVIEGKHSDERGNVTNNFSVRYTLPQGHLTKDVRAELKDGKLTVTSPKTRECDRIVPVRCI